MSLFSSDSSSDAGDVEEAIHIQFNDAEEIPNASRNHEEYDHARHLHSIEKKRLRQHGDSDYDGDSSETEVVREPLKKNKFRKRKMKKICIQKPPTRMRRIIRILLPILALLQTLPMPQDRDIMVAEFFCGVRSIANGGPKHRLRRSGLEIQGLELQPRLSKDCF